MPKNTPIRIIDSQRARGAVFLGGSGTSGGVVDHGALLGLGDNDHPQYVLTTTTLEAGNGLTGGGALSANLTFAVGAGNMITVAADAVGVADGGAYQFIGTGSGTTAGWHLVSELAGDGLTHTTALNVGVSGLGLSVGTDAVTLTSSSNPGAAASILASDAAGALALTKLRTPLIDTAAGNLVLQPAGDLVLDPVGNDVFPQTNYDINLGSLSLKYLTLHAAELWVETLVAQNTIATIGGRILVGPTTTLTRDLAPAAATIYVKHNQMVSGDRVYMEANGSVEFFAITSSATSTGTDYSYTVTRNLDGTGANQWYAGDAMFNTGSVGGGFIDIYSVRGVKAAGEAGPTIVGNVRLSTTYNDWAPRWAIGNLNGLYGYGATTFGFAAGDPAGANIAAEATNGVRLRQGTTDMIVLNTTGASYFAGVMTIGTSGEIRQGTGTLGSNYTGLRIWRDTNVGRIGGYNANVLQWYANTDGKLYAGAGNIVLDATGLTLDIGDYQAGKLFPYVDIAWKAGSAESGRIGSGELNNVDVYGMRFWAGGAGVTQAGNGKFEFISRNGSGTPTGTATIADGAFSGEGQVSGASLYTAGTLEVVGAATFGNEINVRQHTTSNLWSIDAANGTTLVLPASNVYQVSSTSVFSGLIIINDATNGNVGMFLCGGGVVVEVGDTGGTFGTAVGTANSINVYWNGTAEYYIKNTFAASHTLNIFSIRMRAGS